MKTELVIVFMDGKDILLRKVTDFQVTENFTLVVSYGKSFYYNNLIIKSMEYYEVDENGNKVAIK